MISPAKVRRFATYCVIVLAAAVVLIAATHFPYDVDRPLSAEELAKSRQYYAEAYQEGTPAEEQPPSEYETKYLKTATEAAEGEHIEEQVSHFASKYGLRNGAVLDIGSGRGYLQDVVENYTGLDISSNVSRFYHKKFVLGSATAMPFPDDSFDGGWSIWVLEHVPNPEQALLELPARDEEQRRVLHAPCMELQVVGSRRIQRASVFRLRLERQVHQSQHSGARFPGVPGLCTNSGPYPAKRSVLGWAHAAPLSTTPSELQGLLGTGQRCREQH